MSTYISLSFDEDIDTHDLENFKKIRDCIGVSSYKNTLNLYFTSISRNTLFNIALVLREYLDTKGVHLQSQRSDTTTSEIYESLREEAAI